MIRLYRFSPLAIVVALAAAGVIALALTAASRQIPLLRSLEHWTADWRTALLADQHPSQHPRVAVVLVDDDTVQGLPYRSPIDRELLARLIRVVDAAGAQVIGLDFLFDQPTEPLKDRALIEAIKDSANRIVLGSVDDRIEMRDARRAYLAGIERETGAARGFVNLRYEIDDVVRGEAQPDPQPKSRSGPALSFAAAVAAKAGAPVAPASPRIAWLKPPKDGSDTFLTLPAGQLLPPADEAEHKLAQVLLASLEGHVVLIGGDLSDQSDRHATPLAKLGTGPMPGVMVHAHVVAQRLDGRRLDALAPAGEAALVFAMALAGVLLGAIVRSSGLITSTLPVLVLAAIDAMFFAGSRTIIPFAAPVMAWVAGIYIGRVQRWMLRRLNV